MLDTTAPDTPIVTITEHNDPNGQIGSSDLNNGHVQATVQLNASDLANKGSASITVSEDGGKTVTLTVHSDGSVTSSDPTVSGVYNSSTGVVTLGIPAPLEGQNVTVSATQTDEAGNISKQGSDSGVLDTTAPDAPQVSFVSSGSYSYSSYFGINDAHISQPSSGQTALTTVLGDLVNLQATATFVAQSLNFGTSTGAWQDGALTVNGNLGTSGALADFITNSNGSTGTNLQLAGNYGTTSRAIVETGGVFTATTGNYTIAVRADDGYMLLIDGKVVAQEANNQSPTTTQYNIHLDDTANNQHTIQVVYWDQGGRATLQVSLEQNGNSIVNLLQPGSTVTAQVTLNANDQAELVAGGSVHLTGSGNTDLTLHLDNGQLVDSNHNSYSYQNGVISLNMAAPAVGSSISLSATVSDAAGNPSAASSASYTPPSIPTGHLQHDAINDSGSSSTDSITNDKTPVITGLADANSQITVSLNAHSYTTTADASGHWSVSVHDALPDGVYVPMVKAVDANGASATGFATAFSVDTTASITIASDGSGKDAVFNKTEAADATVSGTTTGVEAGQTVTLTFTDSAHHVVSTTTTVGSDGSWTVSPTSLSGLTDGAVTVKAQVSDVAGNVATATHNDKLDTLATITITNDGSGGDHIFNQSEAGTVDVSGTTSGVEVGQPVYVTFSDGANSVSSIVYVQQGGSWDTSKLTLDLSTLDQGKISVTASVTDMAGNSASDSINNDKLDTVAPTLTIGTLAGDDIINAKEHTESLTISGATSAEDGQKVDVVLNGTHYSAVVHGGSWSTIVSAGDVAKLEDGKSYTVTADVRDAAGNPAPEASHVLAVDTTAPDAPQVSFVSAGSYSYSSYFGIDDAHISQPTSGQTAMSTVLGDLVNLQATATFVAQSLNFGTSTGAWQDSSLTVNSNLGTSGALADFITNSNGSTGTNLQLAGNYGTTSRAIVETGGVFTATTGNYTIAVRADDGYMLLIDGKVVAQEANNQSPTTTQYNIHLDDTANNQHTIQVVYWDQGGRATLQVSLEQNGNSIVNLLQPGSTVTAQVTLNANDQAELVAGGSVHLTGSGNTDLTLHLDNGQLVDSNHNSYSYQNGVISLNMAAPAVGSSISLSATVSDAAGNPSAASSASYTPPSIPTGHLQHDAINDSGSSSTDSITNDKTPVITGLADANSQITVSLNAHSYTTTADASGHWSVSVHDALPDGVYVPMVKAVDANGASATGFATAFSVDTTASITIASDGSGKDAVFNKTEAADATVSGTTTGVEAGQTVTLTFTDSAHHVVSTTTTVGSDGSWTVSPTSLSGLTDGAVTVKAQVSDVAGNVATATHNDKLDTLATITITNDGSGGDHIFNQSEAGTVDVSGTTSGVEVGQPVYVTFSDGANSVSSIVYVQQGGSWDTSKLTLDLSTLNQGKISVTASVTDVAGNSASDSISNDILDTQAPLAADLSSTTTQATISGLFNTGLDASGHALAAGQTDENYNLVDQPACANLTSATVVSQSDANGQKWVTNDYAQSQWIGDTSDKHGNYTYQTTFNIASTADLAAILISFDLSADDNVQILVNGQDTGLSYSKLWTQIEHVDLSNSSGVGNLFVVGDNTLTFVVNNSGGGATGLKVDNMVATAQGHSLELDVSLAGTGALVNDKLTFTAVENGVSSSTTHVLTGYDISHGVISEAQQQPDGNTVSTYTATLTDKAGNVSTLASESVFGSGNHAVSDGVGVDTFKWTLASNGSSSAAATTTISHFDLADHASGGSTLDLKDLLQGENHASGSGNLTSYLHFTQSGSDTTVHVSASGGFANSTAGDTVDIVLKGVSLADLGGGLANTSDTQIIQNLLNHGKLITD